MNDCQRFEEALRAHVADELGPEDGEALERHAEQCAACRELLSLDRALTDLGPARDEPGPERFAAMRAAVLRRIARERPRAEQAGLPTPARLATSGARPLAAAAAAALLFLTGFAAATIRFHTERPSARPGPPLLREIADDAATNRSLVDVEDSPFIYSDVTFRKLPDGRVALDFDVTRHVSTVEVADSPVVQDVLAQSLLNPSHTGSRLKAISLAAGTMSAKVRDALIFALHHDDNLAVRLKALSILGERSGAEPEVETAVLTTLREDESVQMRLLALDYLAARRLDPETIRRAIDETDDPGAAALMVRLGEYEHESRR